MRVLAIVAALVAVALTVLGLIDLDAIVVGSILFMLLSAASFATRGSRSR